MRRLVAEAGFFQGYHDWERLTQYDHESRVRLTQTAHEIGEAMQETHLLLGSKVVMFGIQAANVGLGKLFVHPDRQSFEATVRSALGGLYLR